MEAAEGLGEQRRKRRRRDEDEVGASMEEESACFQGGTALGTEAEEGEEEMEEGEDVGYGVVEEEEKEEVEWRGSCLQRLPDPC